MSVARLSGSLLAWEPAALKERLSRVFQRHELREMPGRFSIPIVTVYGRAVAVGFLGGHAYGRGACGANPVAARE